MSRIQQQPKDDILLQGWLDECNPKSARGGKEATTRRWVVLQKKGLAVFTDLAAGEEHKIASYPLHGVADISYETEPALFWFSFSAASGTVKFLAPNLAERTKWLAALREWVPIMKMEASREMLEKKAEGQAARELRILQQQLAVQQIANAEHRVIVLSSFREYSRQLIDSLREVLRAIDVILQDRMTAAQYVSSTVDSLVDAANSAIAASSDAAIKREVSSRTRSLIGIAAGFLQEGGHAAHSEVAAQNFAQDASVLREGLLRFIQYLQQLGFCTDLDAEFSEFHRGVVSLVLNTISHEPENISPPDNVSPVPSSSSSSPPPPIPSASRGPVSKPISFRASQRLLFDALSAAGDAASPPSPSPSSPSSPSSPFSTSPPPLPPPYSAASLTAAVGSSSFNTQPRSPAHDVADNRRAGEEGDVPAPRRNVRRRAEPSPLQRQVSVSAVKALQDMEKLLHQSKSRIRKEGVKKNKQREIFTRTQRVVQQGSRLIGKMKDVCDPPLESGAAAPVLPASLISDLQMEADLLNEGLSAFEESVLSDAVIPVSGASSKRMATRLTGTDQPDIPIFSRPPELAKQIKKDRLHRTSRTPSSHLTPGTLDCFLAGRETIRKLALSIDGPSSAPPPKSISGMPTPPKTGSARMQAPCPPSGPPALPARRSTVGAANRVLVHPCAAAEAISPALAKRLVSLTELGASLMDVLFQSLRTSISLCSPQQEELIAASICGVTLCFSKIFAVAPEVAADSHAQTIAALRCLESALGHTMTAVRAKLGPEHISWDHLAQISSQLSATLGETEDHLRSAILLSKTGSIPDWEVHEVQKRLTMSRRSVVPFRPTKIHELEHQLQSAFCSYLSIVTNEVELFSVYEA